MPHHHPSTIPRWEPTALSRYLVRRLHELGINQAQFATRLHVDQSYVSNFAHGRVPNLDAPGCIAAWASALEVTPENLIAAGELWRYNIVPPGPTEIAPSDRAVLAALSRLSPEARNRVARSLRMLFADPPSLHPAEECLVMQAFQEAVPDAAEQAFAAFLALLRRHGASLSTAPTDTRAACPASAAPSVPARPDPLTR